MPHKNNKGTWTKVSRKTMKAFKRALMPMITRKAGLGRCWKTSLKTDGAGYVQKTFKGTKYTAHRIMACLQFVHYTKHPSKPDSLKRKAKFIEYPTYSKETKMCASHLCGNFWCVRPRHLWFEPEWYQQTRDCCHAVGIKVQGYKCPHNPRCSYLEEGIFPKKK